MAVKHNLLQQMSQQDTSHQEGTSPEEELELEENLDDIEDVEVLKDQLAKEREAKRQILARAKKAEGQLKEKNSQSTQEGEQKPTQNINKTLTENDVDLRVLRAQGMPDELLDKLHKIAAVNGKSLFDAQSDELFVAYKEKYENDQKSEKARLGASRGSGSVKKEKTINSPGLTSTEHKDLWRQQNGQ